MKRTAGFTLIEILVVIGIIGILSAVVLVSVNTARGKAQETAARAQINALVKAIQILALDTGEWPGHQSVGQVSSGGGNELCPDGCAHTLADNEAGLLANDGYINWQGPYMPDIPLDPWGVQYFFDTDYDIEPGGGVTNAAVVGSYGPNGAGNNNYDSDDIIYVLVEE